MHGAYKVPGGKLVVVDLEVSGGRLAGVVVSGDFFAEPDELLDVLVRALDGLPETSTVAQLTTALDERVAAELPGAQLIGATTRDVAIAVRRALGRSTSWADHEFTFLDPGVLPPAMHTALDQVLTEELAAGRRGPTFRFWEWDTPAVVIGLTVIFGAAIYPMYSVAVAHANDFAGPDEFVKIAGGLLLLLGVGTMLGPLFAAEAMERLFPEGLFAFAAIVHLLLALYALFRMSRRSVPAKSERAFQSMPVPKTATPESVILDPRAKDQPAPAPAQPTPQGAGSPRPDDSNVIDLEPID